MATPAQDNGCDCGVFTGTYANYLSRDLELRFGAENSHLLRERITYDLLHAMDELKGLSTARGLVHRWEEEKRRQKLWDDLTELTGASYPTT